MIKMNNIDDKKKDILKELLIDEDEILERVVEKAKKFIKIASKSGSIILLNKEGLSIPDIICLYAIGKYFAHELGKTDTNKFTPKEIATLFNLNNNVVSTRTTELKKDGILEKDNDGYVINFYKIEPILDRILSKSKE